jgi:hypothetical protein
MIGCTCLAAISNILRASTSRSFPRVRISHTLFRSPGSIEAIGIFNSQQQHQIGPKISQLTTTQNKKKKHKAQIADSNTEQTKAKLSSLGFAHYRKTQKLFTAATIT